MFLHYFFSTSDLLRYGDRDDRCYVTFTFFPVKIITHEREQVKTWKHIAEGKRQ